MVERPRTPLKQTEYVSRGDAGTLRGRRFSRCSSAPPRLCASRLISGRRPGCEICGRPLPSGFAMEELIAADYADFTDSQG